MFDKKGQGAMEYLMTYGWAILVVIIVGVVLSYMGVFNPGGGTAKSWSGFSDVRPNDWSCKTASDELSLVLINGAGQQVTNVTIGSTTCASSLAAGKTTVCTVQAGTDTTGSCANVNAGERFEDQVTISYTTASGLSHSSTGSVWGAAE